MFQRCLGFLAGRGGSTEAQETRTVPICGTEPLPYKGNYASTTKYTLLSYFPKALFEQYRRVANIFFTLMAALSLTPWSPVRPWTTWTPLVLVMGVSMVKEAQEDYKRYKQDKEVNERPARVLDTATGEFRTVSWRQVAVGDVLRVHRDEFLPADLFLLASSNPEGTCYIETMNLDGETNLKIKAAPDETRGLGAAPPGQLVQLRASVECEVPNSRLYQFTGNLRIQPPLPPAVAAALAAARQLAAAGAAAALAAAAAAGKPATGWGRAAVKTLELERGDGSRSGKGVGGGKGRGGGRGKPLVLPGLVVTSASAASAGEDDADSSAAGECGASVTVESVAGGDGSVGGLVVDASSRGGGGGVAGGGGGGGGDGGEFVVPLSAASLLLRGCSLRNTDFVYGVVVYAGHDTKIFMNSTEPPSKRSRVERIVDRIIMAVFALLFTWCLISAVYHSRWTASRFPQHWYMRPDRPSAASDPEDVTTTGVVSFFVALLLYSYLVPISLYVSIEMVKVFQAMLLIAADRDMYHAETDTPAQARTSNLNEELGMVAAIMTDKTGTLTRNVMEFFKCSIAGVAYGAGVTETEKANLLRKGTVLDESEEDPTAAKYRERFFNFYDQRLMGNAWFKAHDPATIEMFFRLLAVCHTVIPDGPTDPQGIKYEAESPDEAALVVAAKAFGFFFYKRTSTSVTVRERTPLGEYDVEYEVLNVLEFNSTRKRMSVVIKDKANDRILIFTKGADTVIYERLDAEYAPNEAMKESTARHMEEFGAAGLRTLCLSYAEIDRHWYTHLWQPEWVAAKTSLQDRDEKVAAVSEKIERNLRLLGCTAIEDKLQEGVPECIKQLAMAGIRIWVLTGDKMETAINIGFACSLLREDMMQHTVTASSQRIEELERAGRRAEAEALASELVAKQLDKLEAGFIMSGASNRSATGRDPANNAALIIDGKALSYALSKDLSPVFLRIGLRCKAVVCCRVSPLQKAQVTKLVRSTGSITLAIGDGANDVGMIQRAHIGVGISGQEGMQAVMSADFAIAQFRFLLPLLLVHGQYSYKRITRMIGFFLYKNLLFAVTLFTYSALTTFSGSYVYNDTTMTLFNVLFTSATPLVIGMFDRPLSKRLLLRYPQLYRSGVANADFNPATIAAWLLSAVLEAGVLLMMVLNGASGTTASGAHGMPWGMAEIGAVLFTSVLLTIHLHLALLEESWTWLHHAAVWGSIAVWYLYILGFGSFPVSWSLEMWQLFRGVVAPNPQFWLFSLVVPAAAVTPVAAYLAFKRLQAPTDEDIIRELGKREEGEKRKKPDKACQQPHQCCDQQRQAQQKGGQLQQQQQQLRQLESELCAGKSLGLSSAPSRKTVSFCGSDVAGGGVLLPYSGSNPYHGCTGGGGGSNRVAPEPSPPLPSPFQGVPAAPPPSRYGSISTGNGPGLQAFAAANLSNSPSGEYLAAALVAAGDVSTRPRKPLVGGGDSSSRPAHKPSGDFSTRPTQKQSNPGLWGPLCSAAQSQSGIVLTSAASRGEGLGGGGGGTGPTSVASGAGGATTGHPGTSAPHATGGSPAYLTPAPSGERFGSHRSGCVVPPAAAATATANPSAFTSPSAAAAATAAAAAGPASGPHGVGEATQSSGTRGPSREAPTSPQEGKSRGLGSGGSGGGGGSGGASGGHPSLPRTYSVTRGRAVLSPPPLPPTTTTRAQQQQHQQQEQQQDEEMVTTSSQDSVPSVLCQSVASTNNLNTFMSGEQPPAPRPPGGLTRAGSPRDFVRGPSAGGGGGAAAAATSGGGAAVAAVPSSVSVASSASNRVMPLHRGADGRFTEMGPTLGFGPSKKASSMATRPSMYATSGGGGGGSRSGGASSRRSSSSDSGGAEWGPSSRHLSYSGSHARSPGQPSLLGAAFQMEVPSYVVD